MYVCMYVGLCSHAEVYADKARSAKAASVGRLAITKIIY